jgi:hypothetical protein
MVVVYHCGEPFVKEVKSGAALWMLSKKPVSVEVKPIVV